MQIPKGKLISIGGSEDKGTGIEPGFERKDFLDFLEYGILKRILSEAKGDDPHIEIITSASEIPEEVGDNYLKAFAILGCENVRCMHIKTRNDAFEEDFLERIKVADAVMFSGGDQARLSAIFLGTEFLQILKDRYLNEDFVIAGTSAGAMAMSTVMIESGTSSLLKGEVKIAEGLGFIEDVIIDSHFVARGRFGRLAQAVAINPGCIGMGLGEDTGVVITEGNKMEAIGSKLVLIFDGDDIKHSRIAELEEGQPISIEHLVVHVMARGNHYYIKERQFYPDKPVSEEE